MIKIKIIAHRGYALNVPENSMKAFLAAEKIGADGIETDVQVTKDGFLVLCHNSSVDKVSSGKGKISSLSFEEISRLSFNGEKIALLSEFFEYFQNSSVELFHIEIKPVGKETEKTVSAVLSLAKEYGMTERIIITSFDRNVILCVKRLLPECKTGYLCPAMEKILHYVFASPVKTAKKIGADYIVSHSKYLTERRISEAKKNNIGVYAWTVNNPKEAKKLLSAGIDGIITDEPEKISAELRNVK